MSVSLHDAPPTAADERPTLALAFGETTVELLVEIEGETWESLGEVPLELPDFETRIAALREAGRIVDPSGAPVRLWLPESQVLRRDLAADAEPPADLATAATDLAALCGATRDEMVAAIPPPRADGARTILGAYRETWEEAQAFARDWGFAPGPVSAREVDIAFAVPRTTPSMAAAGRVDPARPRAEAMAWSGAIGAAALASLALVWLALGGWPEAEDSLSLRPFDAEPPGVPATVGADTAGARPDLSADPPPEAAGPGPAGSGIAPPPPGRADVLPDAPRPPSTDRSGAAEIRRAAAGGGDAEPPDVAPLSDGLARLNPSVLGALPDPAALPGVRQLRERERRLAPTAPARPNIRPPVGRLGPPLSPAPRRAPQPGGLRPPALAPTGQDLQRARTAPRPPVLAGAPGRLVVRPVAAAIPTPVAGLEPLVARAPGALLSKLTTVPLRPPRERPDGEKGPSAAISETAPPEGNASAVASAAVGETLPVPPRRPLSLGASADDEAPLEADIVAVAAPMPPERPAAPAAPLGDGSGAPLGDAPGNALGEQASVGPAVVSVALVLPPKKPTPPDGINLDRTLLIGVLNLEGARTALLRVPDGDFVQVRRGSTLHGWTVGMIGRDLLRLTRRGEDRTLHLLRQ